MGRVIQFQPEERRGLKRTEEILSRASEIYQRRLKAREELPRVLALLTRAGLHETVQRAVLAWGERTMDPAAVLEMCEVEAAVHGVRAVFEGGYGD